jgi:hypothetical protein
MVWHSRCKVAALVARAAVEHRRSAPPVDAKGRQQIGETLRDRRIPFGIGQGFEVARGLFIIRANTSPKPPEPTIWTSAMAGALARRLCSGSRGHRQHHRAHVALEHDAPVALCGAAAADARRRRSDGRRLSSAPRRPRAAAAPADARWQDPPAARCLRARRQFGQRDTFEGATRRGGMPVMRGRAAVGCRPTELRTSRQASGRSSSSRIHS